MAFYTFKWSTADADGASVVVRNAASEVVASGSIPDEVSTTNEAFVSYSVDLPAGDTYVATATLPDGRQRTATGVLDHTSPAALSATIATETEGKAERSGNRVVFLGDSTTRGYGADAPINGQTSRRMTNNWPVFATIAADQKFTLGKNSGVTGNTTQQMIDRFDADVTAYSPAVVTIMGGRNDIDYAVPLATYMANIETLVAKVREIGAVPVLCTPLPTNTTTTNTAGVTRRQQIATWAKWVRKYAYDNRIPLIDFFTLAVDETTGGLKASFGATDGIHPHWAGYGMMGAYAAPLLAEVVPPYVPNLPATGGDTDNLLVDPLFLGTPGGDGVPAGGWSKFSSATWATYSAVTRSGWAGKALQIDAAATTGGGTQAQVKQTIAVSAALAVGDAIEVVGRIEAVTLNDAAANAYLRITYEGTAIVDGVAEIGYPVEGVARLRSVVPAGCTGVRIQLLVDPSNSVKQVRFGQVGLYNLTKLGLT